MLTYIVIIGHLLIVTLFMAKYKVVRCPIKSRVSVRFPWSYFFVRSDLRLQLAGTVETLLTL